METEALPNATIALETVMKYRLHVTADRHETPDLDQFVAALLAFALAVDEDDESEEANADPAAVREGKDD